MIPPTTLVRLRSTSGIIIGLYVTMHLSNHALGLISLQAQETARPWVMALWHSPPGQILLYGSLATHAFCGLAALAQRRHYKMPVWEGTQILLGLSIPYLLLVLLVWGHFTVGLHFWLRIRAWYGRVFPALPLAYVLIPTGALLGFAEVGMTTTAHARSDPAWFKRMKTLGIPADTRRAATRAELKEWVVYSWLAVVGAVIIAAQIRNWRRRHERFTVTYPGDYAVEAPIGLSVLEVSRMARRPHVSVCGGRARCTTCRIRIDETAEELPSPNELEAHALARIGAPAGVRLACQLRPQNDVSVYPLLHPGLSIRSRLRGKEFGEERRVTILFIDLRGSTRLAEARLPYDVVFVLNHYLPKWPLLLKPPAATIRISPATV